MSEAIKPKTTNAKPQTNTWYSSWFDTPYYHILYKDRNYREAQLFMDNLTHYLNLPEKAKVLDLACGKCTQKKKYLDSFVLLIQQVHSLQPCLAHYRS